MLRANPWATGELDGNGQHRHRRSRIAVRVCPLFGSLPTLVSGVPYRKTGAAIVTATVRSHFVNARSGLNLVLLFSRA